MKWFIKCLKNYANFNGRARRKEYWMFTLIFLCIYYPLYFVGIYAQLPILSTIGLIFALALCIPSLAVGVRRLHDINKKGIYLLIGLIPIVNFVLLYWFCKEGDKGENQFGPDPKAIEE